MKRYARHLIASVFFSLITGLLLATCTPQSSQQDPAKNIELLKDALLQNRLDDAKRLLEVIHSDSKLWNKESKTIGAICLKKAKESSGAGKLDETKEYLYIIDVSSPEWKDEGQDLYWETLEREEIIPQNSRAAKRTGSQR